MAMALVLFVVACAPRVGALGELADCRTLVKSYMQGPGEVGRTDEFINADLQTKYAIYLCANQYVHPPDLSLAGAFAAGGAETAGFLRERLEETESDATVRDILRVYVEMHRQGTYEVDADVDLMRLLNDRVGQIRNDAWRDYGSILLSEINHE
jgi:hypothetical protein